MHAMHARSAAPLLLVLLSFTASAHDSDLPRRHFRESAVAQLGERFRQADTDGDGYLTRAEARRKMQRVFDHFTQIDRTGKGYVSEAELYWFAAEQLNERRAVPAF